LRKIVPFDDPQQMQPGPCPRLSICVLSMLFNGSETG
jgi:hypothetical protein